jgi:hypothetical protein
MQVLSSGGDVFSAVAAEAFGVSSAGAVTPEARQHAKRIVYVGTAAPGHAPQCAAAPGFATAVFGTLCVFVWEVTKRRRQCVRGSVSARAYVSGWEHTPPCVCHVARPVVGTVFCTGWGTRSWPRRWTSPPARLWP